MTNVPKDPIILLSYINTKLRDDFASLDELCASLEINKGELTEKLANINYTYDDTLNKFI